MTIVGFRCRHCRWFISKAERDALRFEVQCARCGPNGFLEDATLPRGLTDGERLTLGRWRLGTRVRKKSGSSWQGHVVGYYSTSLTPIGYAVESEREPGSVQIYPAAALEPLQAADVN